MKLLGNYIKEYGESGVYPFHMPGHKRNAGRLPDWNPYLLDVTEIEGMDNLHCPVGVLKDAMEQAARLYGAEESWFLVNGSTGGILSAVSCAAKPGETLLAARNCHKSVYNAIFLNQLNSMYLYPEWVEEYGILGGVDPDEVRKALKSNPQIRGVVITSPTYEGVVSDIGAISKVVHEYGIPLIVDEAHGSHFGFSGDFPESAVKKGADLVIQSLHKTLPALTQSAILHVQGNLADRKRLKQYLGIYQTSSPSYVLMASMDCCVNFLKEQGNIAMREYGERLLKLREEIGRLAHIKLPGSELLGKASVYDVDISKILLSLCGLNHGGKWLYEQLQNRFKLPCEMYMDHYVLAMTSVLDTDEGFDRLAGALRELDKELFFTGKAAKELLAAVRPEVCMSIYEGSNKKAVAIPLTEAAGHVSTEYIYLYPPGIPILAPGERIEEELIGRLCAYLAEGFELQGLWDGAGSSILVACDD